MTVLDVLPCRLVRLGKWTHNLDLYPDIELDRITLSNEIARGRKQSVPIFDEPEPGGHLG